MFVFVSDYFVQDYSGGAELTTDAIIKGTRFPVLTIHSSTLTRSYIDAHRDKYWIFGNFSALDNRTILYCCKNLKYSIIEYDYKYCDYRLPQKHIAIEGECGCEFAQRGKMVSIFFAKAENLWFMSQSQREFYFKKFPFLKKTESKVLSSVFDSQTLQYISELKKRKKEKKDVWLIQDSNSWVKGTEDAVKYAKDNNLKYELFKDIEYRHMLEKFAGYKGFIFLPKSFDTCPRTVIEATLLGCETILNDNVQHKNEEWFKQSSEKILEYLSLRPGLFWDSIRHNRIPKSNKNHENTHFKIVIPAYNSEEWISRTLESVASQNYSNYECIVRDDISTDSTWAKMQKYAKNKKFKLIKNSKKKYALKNIHESILDSSPDKEDVIVVLDGDDWLSNNEVLGLLNERYEQKKCMMTYGSFVRYPDANIGQEASKYPESVIQKNSYRSAQWCASHLKTFKYELWSKVRDKDMRDEDGEFYEISYDQAMMLPLLEMCGPLAQYIPEILYVYNIGNPNAVNKIKAKKQYDTMLRIRQREPYTRV